MQRVLPLTERWTVLERSQNTGVVLDCLRNCNVALRWLMLHGAAKQRSLADSVASVSPGPAAVAALLLDTSLLEYEVRTLARTVDFSENPVHWHVRGRANAVFFAEQLPRWAVGSYKVITGFPL